MCSLGIHFHETKDKDILYQLRDSLQIKYNFYHLLSNTRFSKAFLNSRSVFEFLISTKCQSLKGILKAFQKDLAKALAKHTTKRDLCRISEITVCKSKRRKSRQTESIFQRRA